MSAPPGDALSIATWRKASYSNPNGGCVEVARPGTPVVGIRDSKAPYAGLLTITPNVFETFLDLVKS